VINVGFEHYAPQWVEFEIQDPGLWLEDLSPRDTLLELLGQPRVEWLDAAEGGRYCVLWYRGRPAGWRLAFERPEDATLYALTWS
jgi:hypothetical protein